MKTPTGLFVGRILPLVAVLAALLPVVSARATLLTSSYETQLEAWLGQGDLSFNNIFTKTTGDGKTAANFHAAADGQGATFTLMSVQTNLGGLQVIGGYNPQSWFNSSTFAGSLNTAPGGSAFIYNLTESRVQTQNNSFWGQYQTYNFSSWGPAFGAGNDFYADFSLTNGLAFTMSYGNDGRSITSGSDSALYYDYFTIADIEVFTFGAATVSVPEGTSTAALLLVSVAGMVAARRRFAAV